MVSPHTPSHCFLINRGSHTARMIARRFQLYHIAIQTQFGSLGDPPVAAALSLLFATVDLWYIITHTGLLHVYISTCIQLYPSHFKTKIIPEEGPYPTAKVPILQLEWKDLWFYILLGQVGDPTGRTRRTWYCGPRVQCFAICDWIKRWIYRYTDICILWSAL